jgi:hypothetical protein
MRVVHMRVVHTQVVDTQVSYTRVEHSTRADLRDAARAGAAAKRR